LKQENIEVDINRNLCVGLSLLGIIAHYDEKEISKDPLLKNIRNMLKKKHTLVKNGTKSEMMGANELYARRAIDKEHDVKKRQKIADNYKNLNRKIFRMQQTFNAHSAIADKTFLQLEGLLKDNFTVSASSMIFAILRKNEEMVKWYKFNVRKIEKKQELDMKNNPHMFRSSLFVTKLLEYLDANIEEFMTNELESRGASR